jgi:uroporphyrinogen decarboxylase
MPVRELGVDAAVLFADIMLPLQPMGVELGSSRMSDRSSTDRSVRRTSLVASVPPEDDVHPEAIRLVHQRSTAGRRDRFLGRPFTLACYLIEGHRRAISPPQAFMYQARGVARHGPPRDDGHRLSPGQADAGADVLQLFDSWIGGSDRPTTPLRPAPWTDLRRLVDVPTIHFGTGTAALLELLAEAGGDVIGLDHRLSLADAWRRLGPQRGVQGNLDAARLLAGWEATRDGARAVLDEAGGRPGHVFNLGHGVLSDTDPDLLRRLVDYVHEETAVLGAPTGRSR